MALQILVLHVFLCVQMRFDFFPRKAEMHCYSANSVFTGESLQ